MVRRRSARVSVLAGALLVAPLLGSCTLVFESGGDPPVPVNPPPEVVLDLSLSNERALDLLLVVDDSGSMLEKQRVLGQGFDQLLASLVGPGEGPVDLHVGVVSSSMGTFGVDLGGITCRNDRGALLGADRCGVTGTYLRETADGNRNFPGTMAEAVSCLTDLGAGGCGFEQHLAAMHAALRNDNGGSSTFLRPWAKLSVVILAAEDDCSARGPEFCGPASAELGSLDSFRCFEFGVECDGPADPRVPGPRTNCRPSNDTTYLLGVDGYVDYLTSLKADRADVMVAVITGADQPVQVTVTPPPGGGPLRPDLVPSCQYQGLSNTETADPAVRLTAFADRLAMATAQEGRAPRGVTTSVCSNDLGPALAEIGAAAHDLFGDPCLRAALADTNPNLPGLQAGCAVEVVTSPGSPFQISTVIEPCNELAPSLCYRIAPDLARCAGTPDALALTVEQQVGPLPPGVRVHARCQIE